jgi:hypothetical protein
MTSDLPVAGQKRLFALLPTATLIGVALFISAVEGAEALRTCVLEEPLRRCWQDELIHFSFDAPGEDTALMLTDEQGAALICQLSNVRHDSQKGRITGSVWTVVTLEPGARKVFHLVSGRGPASSTLSVSQEGGFIVLSNERMAIRLPDWSGRAQRPVNLVNLPAPVAAVRGGGTEWLTRGEWINDGPSLVVREAKTEIVERGPVRAGVRLSLIFENGQSYQAVIQLALAQDAAIVTEHSTIASPGVGFRLSMIPGLNANRVLWHNQWKETSHAKSFALTNSALDFKSEVVLCKIRPWSFWWIGDLTMWAGFYREGAEPLVGVLALRPSQWSPSGWDGFDRTEIPVTAGPGPRLDLTFPLAAARASDPSPEELAPLHRQWAITVGQTKEHLAGLAPEPAGTTSPALKLRRQLIQLSEFPLDEVKDYGFDFRPSHPNAEHPSLILSGADVERVRRQARTVPAYREAAEAARKYVIDATHSDRTFETEGWEAFYRKNYVGNYLVEKLPEAYLTSEDPIFAEMLAAAVLNLARESLNTFLDTPPRPALGAYGPWFSEIWMRLALNYDLIAGAGLLTAEDEAFVRRTLVFGAHVLSHPDYWNTSRGLCSANPNMTNSILLPRGMLSLLLSGHPKSPEWLQAAENELQHELKEWISPGGAWVENPGYQAASLDSLFLLAQAIRNVRGRDYFADAQFKATMDYYGFILTPPDRRFPPKRPQADSEPGGPPASPMTQPSVGDMFSGYVTCFNGWMAKAAADSDPAFSARQQFFWQSQRSTLASAGRAKGFVMALVDPELPAAPPKELSRSFPGFGSIMRSSWTDPEASYVAHRTGPNVHHFHDDFNSIVYYAKGAPLCLDFGNCYQPVHRHEPWYHNRVSFHKSDSPQTFGSTGDLVLMRDLPSTACYSYGRTRGGGNQEDHRHVLLVRSGDRRDTTYLVIRDQTVNGQPDQRFHWNLWCLAGEPEIVGNRIHFPGRMGVDLDVHLLGPVRPEVEKDHWAWEQHIYVWGPFAEQQHGIRATKHLSKEDFLAVLHPRKQGQEAARTTTLAEGNAIRIEHSEGTDYVLLAPRTAADVRDGEVNLQGQVALVRSGPGGRLTLAVLQGDPAEASAGDWSLKSTAPVALTIHGQQVTGETGGEAQEAVVTLPPGYPNVNVAIDGRTIEAKREGRELVVPLPAGEHRWEIRLP